MQFSPCPASCPPARWMRWAGGSLGARLGSLGARLGLAGASAHLWHELGLRLSRVLATVPRSPLHPGGITEQRVGVRPRWLDIGVPGRGLACGSFSGHPSCWSSFFYQEYRLGVFLATCLPEDSRAIFQSICGAGVRRARFQFSARAAARGAGRRRCSATGTRRAPGVLEGLLAGPVWDDRAE